ncbi:MAG: DUF202 domain-containing protein [Nitrospirota bacterium]
MAEQKNIKKSQNRRVHMANERTFLAWVRTSIGLMAFGFVVERFALFVKQISFYLEKNGGGKAAELPAPTPGYSSVVGVILVFLGMVMVVLAFIRYKKVEKEIDEDTYRPSLLLDVMLALSVFGVGLFLVMYLLYRM